MARNNRRLSPYEIISKDRLKSTRLRQSGQCNDGSDRSEQVPDSKLDRIRPWPNKPKKVRFFSDRAELSLSYQVVVITALAVVIVVLLVMRLGRRASDNTGQAPDMSQKKEVQQGQISDVGTDQVAQTDNFVGQSGQKAVAHKLGDHIIVIQNSKFRSHLVPVKKYFDDHGIETEIAQAGSMYRIVTRQKFQNPEKKGTDGYAVKQRIIELGTGFKAPQGYPGFGRKPFHDAYGMKISQ